MAKRLKSLTSLMTLAALTTIKQGENSMKIGDKVSFLSTAGGGTVAGFQSGNIVLVEDEDGFQIPTLKSDLVVVGSSDDYDISNVISKRSAKATEPEEEKETEPADRPITFKPAAIERKDGNRLNCYLAFVPSDPKNLSKTHFECYFVNDSNYYISYIYLRQESGSYALHHSEEVQPNMLAYIEDVGYADLNQLERITIQMMAYKRDKNFLLKEPMSINLRLDLTKFYKLHCFTDNDFFESPALLYDIVRDDKPADRSEDDEAIVRLSQSGIGSEAKSAKKEDPEQGESTYVRRYETVGKPQRNPFLPKHKKPEVVIDLHASALLDSTTGLKPKEILEYQMDKFRSTMAEYQHRHGTRIVFIHGKGEGVLRQSIINELKHSYKNSTYQDASFLEYGYGATLVIIK